MTLKNLKKIKILFFYFIPSLIDLYNCSNLKFFNSKMEVTESEKLQWQTYVPSVSREPLNVYYMRQASDAYNASGYSFNIKSPAQNALLDPEAYIKYKIRIRDTGTDLIINKLHSVGSSSLEANMNIKTPGGTADFYEPLVAGPTRVAFRQGNIMQRATQSIVLTINGYSIDTQPWKWVDILNRIYVSNKQSKYVFSASGGMFDSGNHGLLAYQDNRYFKDKSNASAWQISLQGYPNFNLIDNKKEDQATDESSTSTYNIYPLFPEHDLFYNPGFSDRIAQFFRLVRGSARDDVVTGSSLPGTIGYLGNAKVTSDQYYYDFEIIEPIPIPPFKLYQNDYSMGVIPHVKDMIIRGNFSPNMISNILQANANIVLSTTKYLSLYWTGIGAGDCEILLKWYTPPAAISIPREISIPLRKIDLNTFSVNLISTTIDLTNHSNRIAAISQYNISLEAVPDLLLIYVRQRLDSCTTNQPNDFLFELQNLQIIMENNGGKLTQITSYQMWKNWLKYVKHADVEKEEYDEWRKYLYVAILKPEDYGIIRGPGYDNSVVLGITGNVYNWHINPKMGRMTQAEYFVPNAIELVVCSIYDRWSLTLTDNGHARAGLTRIRDNSVAGMSNIPAPALAAQNPAGIASLMQ